MDQMIPSYITDGDPRVYGFSYSEGIVPNSIFDSGFGEAVPSSDGAPPVRASADGTVSQQAQEQAQVQTSRGVQQQYQAQNMQVLQSEQSARSLYRPAPTAPMYPAANQNAQAQVSRGAPSMPALYPGVPNAGAFAGLENMPQPPMPPTPHRGPQGYPWQGHPQAGQPHPLMGPNGTSPLHMGGPNLPAYATAPQQPMAYTGAVYPLNTPGVQQQNNGNSLFGGFAGVDFGALDDHLDSELGRTKKEKEPKAPKSRDAQGKGGWVYRQFADGSIQIVVSDSPSLPVGTRLTAQSHPRPWNAITAEIGTWQQFIKDRWSRRGQAALSLLDAGTKVAGQIKGRKKRRRRRRRKAAAAPMPEIPYDTGEDEGEGEGMPQWALPAILGLVGLAGLAIWASGNRPAPKGRE